MDSTEQVWYNWRQETLAIMLYQHEGEINRV